MNISNNQIKGVSPMNNKHIYDIRNYRPTIKNENQMPFGRRINGCDDKRRFATFEEAKKQASQLEYDYLITKYITYWCSRHQCWHTAHEFDYIKEKKMKTSEDYQTIVQMLSYDSTLKRAG